MSFQVFVKDRLSRPAKNVRVFIKWKGGTSSGRTDDNGMFDSGVGKGTIDYMTVDGIEVARDVWIDRDNYIWPAKVARSS